MESNLKNSKKQELLALWVNLKVEKAENIFKMLAFVAFCCVLEICGIDDDSPHMIEQI